MINYSKDSEYHTQVNNKVFPHSTCNTTSMIMALKQAGYECDFSNTEQPEDVLTKLLQTEKYWLMMDRLNSDLRKQDYRPNEIHACLREATNEIIGKQVDYFSVEVPVLRIKQHLTSGGGVVLSGRFRLSDGTVLNHIVSLAGYGDDCFIIDDPYGNFRTDYKDRRGNNIVITEDEFFTIFKGSELYKWAHLIQPRSKV